MKLLPIASLSLALYGVFDWIKKAKATSSNTSVKIGMPKPISKDAQTTIQNSDAKVAPIPVPKPAVGTTLIPMAKPSLDDRNNYQANNAYDTKYDGLFKYYGDIHNLDWKLLKAIAITESSLNHQAKNPADPSFGLMQVLCANNGPDSPCRNKLNVEGWHLATPNNLMQPDFNVRIASQILAWNIKTYGKNKGIATYNNWDARYAQTNGPFPNQSYVEKVLRYYAELQ